MNIYFASTKLDNNKKVEEYNIDDGDAIVQNKGDLKDIIDIKFLSYEPDMLDWSDDLNEARVKMKCGHVISRDSMTIFLRSLLSEKKFVIRCPADKPNGTLCDTEWDYG